MAIDIQCEKLISLSAAAKLLPRRRGGRRTHLATLYRWSTSGRRGVRLEVLQMGGGRVTSVEAVQRFFDRLSAMAGLATDYQDVPRTPAQRKRESARAALELTKQGV